jgi:adenylate cyclase
MKKYSTVPEFKAGCHCGIVFTSEVGDIKKSIVYNGDTMNTTSRIESECRTYGKEILVSETLINQTVLNENFIAEKVGAVTLRGKSGEITLWTIKEINE